MEFVFPDPFTWAADARRLAMPIGNVQAVVTIPVKDEVDSIGACLTALARQVALDGSPLQPGTFAVLLLLNNCTDGTADRAHALAPDLPFPLRLHACELPPSHAHAGAARRLAMDAAAGWLIAEDAEAGAILTTDADTRVDATWVAHQLLAFADGIDAVAGYVIDDPKEHRQLPAALRRRGRWEATYGWLLTELQSRLDPDPDDPWPRHLMAAGATLGVTLAAYLQVGGVPVLPVGEDRAFVHLLQDSGLRVRHCMRTRVVTSCRLTGRAGGGMADTMRHRIAEPDSPCDETMEPARAAWRRNIWRALLRREHAAGTLSAHGEWTQALGIPEAIPADLIRIPRFRDFWEELERTSESLVYQTLRPADLPGEIAVAREMLRGERQKESASFLKKRSKKLLSIRLKS